MLELSKMTNLTDLECLSPKMAKNMKDNGNKIKFMEAAPIFTKRENTIKGSFKTEKSMAKELINGEMADTTQENGKIICKMETVFFQIKMGKLWSGNGEKERL